MKTEKPFKLTDNLSYRMGLLVKYAAKVLHEVFDAELISLTRNQWKVIAVVGNFSNISAKEITEKIDIDKFGTSRAIKKLVDKKIIRRSVNSNDKRETRLSLTALGNKQYQASTLIAQDLGAELMNTLTKEEARVFNKAITKLTEKAIHWHEREKP